MKQADSKRILELLTDLSESINGPRPEERRPKVGRPLSDRVDELHTKLERLDTRVSEVQLGLATLAATTTAQFQKVDVQFTRMNARFDRVDRDLAATRVELVDHMERIHSELTGRIVDLELPGPGGRGGSGGGSGGGMPLAS